MPKIAIVTDSSTCLPPELLRDNRITTVPLTFLVNSDVYYDGSLTGRDFYALLRASHKFPTTASAAPEAFLEAFRQAARTAEAALCVTLPAAFSGTFNSARAAADLLRQELPSFPVRVVDSHCLAMCHGFAVLAAARAAASGASLDSAESVVREVAARSYLIGVLDTMRYLAKSGRAPIVLHWATSLLQIKPILAAKGEDVRAIARPRTMRTALSRLLTHVEARLDDQRPLHMAVMHADAPAVADSLAGAIRERFQPEELLVTEFSSVAGAHTGPGFVAVAFFSGEPSGFTGDALPVGAQASQTGVEEDARRLESALADLPAPQERPPLVLVSGLPGSGKSYFSRELTKRYPLAHLNSDVMRRQLFARPSHSAAESARLFAAIHLLVERLLDRGVGVVLDATSLKEAHRQPLYDIAERTGANAVIVRTEAPPSVARERLGARAQAKGAADASEATAAVYDRMRREVEPIERPHIRVDTSGELEAALQEVLRRLENVSERLAG